MDLQTREQLFNWGYHVAVNKLPRDVHELTGEDAEVWLQGYDFAVREMEGKECTR
jgi:hypothetical protein